MPLEEDLLMEQTVTERPFRQERQINQQQTGHNGPVGTGGAKFQEPPQNWYSRRQAGCGRTHVPSGSYRGDYQTQDKGQKPECRDFINGKCTRTFCKYLHRVSGGQDEPKFSICLDFLNGKCAHGAYCKFQHNESDRHDGFSSYGNRNLGMAVNLGTSQFGGGNTDDDSRSRPFSRECSRRSPCRKFQIGRCLHGANCLYLHSENTTYVGSRYDWSTERQIGVATTSRNPEFGEHNVENTVRTPQAHDESNKGNDPSTWSPSRVCRSRSPCRNFRKGRCYRGATCRYLHLEHSAFVGSWPDYTAHHCQEIPATSENHDFGKGSIDFTLRASQEQGETNKVSDLSLQFIPRDHRGRSPCRKFLLGKCEHGRFCRYWHPVMSDGPGCDSRTQQHQGLARTSGDTIFGERNKDITSSTSQQHAGSNLSAHEQNRAWSMKNSMQSASNAENMDITSSNWSSEKQRSRPLGEFHGDWRKREFCLKFSKGRCDRGHSCRYLHSFHEYARSIPDWSKHYHFEAAAVSKNFDEEHKYFPSMMYQEHDHDKMNNMQLSEDMHSRSDLESPDGFPNEKIKRQSADAMVKPDKFDQKDGAPVINQKCEISVGAMMSNCDSVEADDGINLWSQPLKKRRCRSRSPFTARDGFDCRSIKRVEFESSFPGHRRYNGVPFRYPQRRSYQYNQPRYQTDNPTHSKVPATSVGSCSQEVIKDSHMMETTGHDKVMIHGGHLDRCASGRLDLNSEILNQKCEAELAKDAVQPSDVREDNMDSKVVGFLEGSCSQEGSEASDLTKTQGHGGFLSHGIQLGQCPGSCLDSDFAILNQKSDAECAKGDIKISHVEQGGKELITSSGEIDISQGQSAIDLEEAESDPTSSCEMDQIRPMDTDVGVLNEGNNAEVNANSGQEGGQKIEALETHSRSRRRKTHSRCLVETMKEEVSDPTPQGLSNGSAGEIPSNPDIVSAVRVSDDMKISSQTSSVQNLLTIDHPIQQLEPELGVINNEIQNNIGLALDDMEDGALLVGHPDSCSMQTSGSSSKTAKLNFKRKLLILDVNGLLADIVADFPSGYKPDTVVSMKAVFKRPFCDDFLEFCFERFDVGVWSSRNKKNVERVVDFLMGDTKKRLLFCWDQSHCTETGYKTVENKDKPLVLKELKKLWEKQVADLPWEKGYYNETNTVLLDDSPYKALRNPPYTAVFPYPYSFKDVEDKSLGPGGDLRVYLERLAGADNVQKLIQENPYGQRPITKSNLSWAFYSKIVFAGQNEGNAKDTPAAS